MIKTCNACGKEFDCGRAWNTTTCPECLERGVKWCCTCQVVLPLSSFTAKSPGGYHSSCKQCTSSCSAATARLRRSIDEEYRKRQCAQRAKYVAKQLETNKEAFMAKQLQAYHIWYDRVKANPALWSAYVDADKAYKKQRYATDPSYRLKELQKNHARRAIVSSSPLTTEDWHSIIEFFDNSCAYCGSHTELTMDHVVPISNGGEHSIGNVIVACRSCNSSKGSKDLFEWYTAQNCYSEDRLIKILAYLMTQEDE